MGEQEQEMAKQIQNIANANEGKDFRIEGFIVMGQIHAFMIYSIRVDSEVITTN
jgi:hypothetical protein